MPKKICDMDCFSCVFDDCKYDGSQTAKEPKGKNESKTIYRKAERV